LADRLELDLVLAGAQSFSDSLRNNVISGFVPDAKSMWKKSFGGGMMLDYSMNF
jgi:hypothetical protein